MTALVGIGRARSAFVLSAVALSHLLALVWALSRPADEPRKAPVQVGLFGEKRVKLIDRDERSHIGDIRDCPNEYLGVGLTHVFNGRIIDVAGGGPAARAGVQVGDVLENAWEMSAQEGQPYKDMVISRDGVKRHLRLYVEPICYRTEAG